MILAGTGHRPNKLGGYTHNASRHLIELATFGLRMLKPDLVISGMALGWDQALARAALALGIPFHAYVPFTGQDSAWPENSRQEYADLLSKAEKTVITSPGGYSAYKMQIRNEEMVKASDHVLAIWDGSEGGTRNCVRFAEKCNKPITNLWDIYQFEV